MPWPTLSVQQCPQRGRPVRRNDHIRLPLRKSRKTQIELEEASVLGGKATPRLSLALEVPKAVLVSADQLGPAWRGWSPPPGRRGD